MVPTQGRIVLYRLTAAQAEIVNVRRAHATDRRDVMRDMKFGFQAHVGNYCSAGEVMPMIVAKVWPNEYGDQPGVNGQVILDGNDALWVTSTKEGDEPGTWHWPPRT